MVCLPACLLICLLVPPMVFAQADGIVLVLLNHTFLEGRVLSVCGIKKIFFVVVVIFGF